MRSLLVAALAVWQRRGMRWRPDLQVTVYEAGRDLAVLSPAKWLMTVV